MTFSQPEMHGQGRLITFYLNVHHQGLIVQVPFSPYTLHMFKMFCPSQNHMGEQQHSIGGIHEISGFKF
jgi:hypothetical protein